LIAIESLPASLSFMTAIDAADTLTLFRSGKTANLLTIAILPLRRNSPQDKELGIGRAETRGRTPPSIMTATPADVALVGVRGV